MSIRQAANSISDLTSHRFSGNYALYNSKLFHLLPPILNPFNERDGHLIYFSSNALDNVYIKFSAMVFLFYTSLFIATDTISILLMGAISKRRYFTWIGKYVIPLVLIASLFYIVRDFSIAYSGLRTIIVISGTYVGFWELNYYRKE